MTVDATNLPAHIGIIMDGNGRWAQMRGQDRTVGHREGSKAVRRIVRVARRLGVKALTLYAFSEQNWARPDLEVGALMQLLHEFVLSERDEILDNGIRLNAVGDLHKLPSFVRSALDALREESSNRDEMTLTLALSYGGREEIVNAARELAREVQAGTIQVEDITEDALHARIPSVSRVGDPDLVIRTGGERRISNFLLYGLAYAELYFSDALWPDFGEKDLCEAIESYQRRERRYGLVGKTMFPPARVADDDESGPKVDGIAVLGGIRLVG
jgi:undecaprenyl diphosphate synthase